MPFELRPIIDEIASKADDFLAGAANREQGRAGISELLTMDFNFLDGADRKRVTDAVMLILEQEDFFNPEFVGNPFNEEDDE